MPNSLQLKYLEEPETATIQELRTKSWKTLVLRKLCPVDDCSRDRYFELSTDNLGKIFRGSDQIDTNSKFSWKQEKRNDWKNESPKTSASNQNTSQNC